MVQTILKQREVYGFIQKIKHHILMADIENNDDFKSFKSKGKLLGNAVAGANGKMLIKNATIDVPLKYLSYFWRSLKVPLINCKVELKLKWAEYCVLSLASNENDINDNDNANNIVFTIEGTKLYVPVVTLSARDNQNLSRLLSKGFERSVNCNEYKAKSDNKYMTDEFRYFLESNCVGVNRLFLFIQIVVTVLKELMLENIIYQKV